MRSRVLECRALSIEQITDLGAQMLECGAFTISMENCEMLREKLKLKVENCEKLREKLDLKVNVDKGKLKAEN